MALKSRLSISTSELPEPPKKLSTRANTSLLSTTISPNPRRGSIRKTCRLDGAGSDRKNPPNLTESVEATLISADFFIRLENDFLNNRENIWLIISSVGKRPRITFSWPARS